MLGAKNLLSQATSWFSKGSPAQNDEVETDSMCYQDYSQNCCTSPHRRSSHESTISRLPMANPHKPTDEIAAVVVTICGGSSYDTLFTSVPLQSDEGTKVMGYSVSANKGVENLLALLTPGSAAPSGGDGQAELFTELMEALGEVESDCVVINFECCSAYSDNGFVEAQKGPSPTMQLIMRAISRGFMVMCSDFSLKALIAKWDQAGGELGPCPFVKVSEFGGTMTLRFTPKDLVECESSAQLQKVGELCNEGTVKVSCPGGTIVYGVDDKAADTPAYTLQKLTVVDPAASGIAVPEHLQCKIGDVSGPAGHVLLTYPTGGAILASAGHWKSLMSFDVEEEQMLAVAEDAYGSDYTSRVRCDLEKCSSEVERSAVRSEWAATFVQQSSPCKMKKSATRY
mmetsp:Transcript_116240/g.163398  ORF Transcript_116240/g.163398 Transcript_116240/m.163398 type:complete len:399 (+) Transcript_116240:156-1352(+)